MSNKKKLVEDNLEELSKRIGLLIKQYNLLAESEDIGTRMLFVNATASDVPDSNSSDFPKNIYDVVVDYNEEQGWSSSQSCW